METELPLPELGLSPAEAAAHFDQLQTKLVDLWKYIQAMNQSEQTIVVVPSMTIDSDLKGAEMQAYEERFLFLLLLLRQPRARLIYVTSQAINPSIIEGAKEQAKKATGGLSPGTLNWPGLLRKLDRTDPSYKT